MGWMHDLESQMPLEFFRKSSEIPLPFTPRTKFRSEKFIIWFSTFYTWYFSTVFLQPTFLTISILGNKHLSSLYKSALFATVTWHEVCREMSNKDEVIIVLQVPHDSFNITITAHPCSAVQMSEIKQYKRTGGLFISICLLIFIELTLVDFRVKSLERKVYPN